MKNRILALFLLLSSTGFAQPLYTAYVTGSVVDASTGTLMANYPVMIMDSSNAIGGGTSIVLFTDNGGYFMDTIDLYAQSGVLMVQAEDSCTGNWISSFHSYGGGTPTTFVTYDTLAICGSSTGGGGTGGGGNSYACQALFNFDSTLTGNGQIVLYNTSTFDSIFQNSFQSFQWFWGDGTGSTGAYPSHQYTQSGTFVICLQVDVLDSNATGSISCSSTYCDTIAIDSSGNVSYKGVNVQLNVYSPEQMALEEKELARFRLYPNPSRGTFHFISEVATSLIISDMAGHIVAERKEVKTAEFTGLKSGTYIIQALNARGTRRSVLVVQ